MRRVRYVVACSLDGYIAGENGEADWIIMDPEIDFGALFAQFDTVLAGRRTFEGMAGSDRGQMPGIKMFVFSTTLQQRDYPDVTIVPDKPAEMLATLRASPGKDIWRCGGGSLFRSLRDSGLVDTIEVSVIPVLLGTGIPLVPGGAIRSKLKLTGHKVYGTGIVSLEYSI